MLIIIAFLGYRVLDNRVYNQVKILHMHFVKIGRRGIKILQDRLFAAIQFSFFFRQPFCIVEIKPLQVPGVHFRQIGFIVVLQIISYPVDSIFLPVKILCFGKVEHRIDARFYFKTLQQNVLFIALW